MSTSFNLTLIVGVKFLNQLFRSTEAQGLHFTTYHVWPQIDVHNNNAVLC